MNNEPPTVNHPFMMIMLFSENERQNLWILIAT